MSTKSITESTVSELIEREKKHRFFIKLIDTELSKRGTKTEQKKSPIKKSPKKKAITYGTRDEMKEVLEKHKIDFKSNMNKTDLLSLVKKNNLVRIVEEHHKNKLK